jgi:hypothetical protein
MFITDPGSGFVHPGSRGKKNTGFRIRNTAKKSFFTYFLLIQQVRYVHFIGRLVDDKIPVYKCHTTVVSDPANTPQKKEQTIPVSTVLSTVSTV